MSFGQRLRERREALGISRAELAARLGISKSAVSNYETGYNAVREDILLRLFDILEVDPNYLYQDSFNSQGLQYSAEELSLVQKYRSLPGSGRQALDTVADALLDCQEALELGTEPKDVPEIPLYRCPAAAGFAAPVFGEDYDLIPLAPGAPRGADFAVRIQGDSMEPFIQDGSVVYVNRDPLANGDIGIFCVDGETLCKQYYRDPLGIVYLFSLNRRRSAADVVLPSDSGRSLVCLGRVMLRQRPSIPM